MTDQTVSKEAATVMSDPLLNWVQEDLEQRFGFRGGRFTSCNKLFTFLAALLLAAGFYLGVVYCLKPFQQTAFVANMFLTHGLIPYPIVILFFWAIAILTVKWRKLAYQRRALNLAAVPQEPGFVLDRRTAPEVLKRLHALVDDPRNFVLLNRIERALSNLRNIGNISEAANILRTQAQYDEEQAASSYKMVSGFVWATPVLGFIGTVLGLSVAIGGFGAALEASGDLNAIKDSLRATTAGLSTAFETTFVALVATLIIQLYMTHLQHEESKFLDECSDYCHANLVSKLRLTD